MTDWLLLRSSRYGQTKVYCRFDGNNWIYLGASAVVPRDSVINGSSSSWAPNRHLHHNYIIASTMGPCIGGHKFGQKAVVGSIRCPFPRSLSFLSGALGRSSAWEKLLLLLDNDLNGAWKVYLPANLCQFLASFLHSLDSLAVVGCLILLIDISSSWETFGRLFIFLKGWPISTVSTLTSP